MKKFLSVLETISKDVEKGITAVAPIIGTFEPAITPILTAIESLLSTYDKNGISLSNEQTSAIVQALTVVNSLAQHQTALVTKGN